MENKRPTKGNGKICYLEIPSDNVQESANFYQKVFGWNIRDDNDGNISFDDSVGEVSGMWVTGRKPTSEIGMVISIMVYNISETLDLIKDNGGKVISVDEYDTSEKTSLFADPSGNIFCLYQSGS